MGNGASCPPSHPMYKDGVCIDPKNPNGPATMPTFKNQASASSTPPSAPSPASAPTTNSVPAAVGSSGSGVPAGMYCPACPVCPTK